MENIKLIKNYKTNNELNLEQIVKEYTNYLYVIIKNISNEAFSQEDIEEIIQETFFVIWFNRYKLDDSKLLSSYLAGIVKNIIKKKYRSLKNNLNLDNLEDNLISKSDIFESLLEREQNNIIFKEVTQLNNEDKFIFEMFYCFGKKTKDIAKSLNLKDFVVRSRLHRIRQKLNKRLEEKGYGK